MNNLKDEKFYLCYVKENKAYFTNNWEHQWGDDWNDAPYEYNAGNPYDSWNELIEDNEDLFKCKYKKHAIKLKELYYEFLNEWVKLPCDNDSSYSVEMINEGAVAWIVGKNFVIPAKTEYNDFIKIVEYNNGKIFILKEKE